MGLGQGIAVNLDKYFTGLEVFAGKENVQALKEKLGQYGIQGTVTVYSGPQEKDGEVLIPYTLSSSNGAESVRGLLRFKDTGILYEGFSGDNQVGAVEPAVARLFLGGLYGTNEVSVVPDQGESIYHGALLAAKGCWEVDSASGCDTKQLEVVKNQVQKQKNDALQTEIDKILTILDDMVKWAKKEDAGWGGIDPDDITDVMAKHSTISFIDDKAKKKDLLLQDLHEILKTFTGQKFTRKNGYATCIEKSETETYSCEKTVRKHRTERECLNGNYTCKGGEWVDEREPDECTGTSHYDDCTAKFPGIDTQFQFIDK